MLKLFQRDSLALVEHLVVRDVADAHEPVLVRVQHAPLVLLRAARGLDVKARDVRRGVELRGVPVLVEFHPHRLLEFTDVPVEVDLAPRSLPRLAHPRVERRLRLGVDRAHAERVTGRATPGRTLLTVAAAGSTLGLPRESVVEPRAERPPGAPLSHARRRGFQAFHGARVGDGDAGTRDRLAALRGGPRAAALAAVRARARGWFAFPRLQRPSLPGRRRTERPSFRSFGSGRADLSRDRRRRVHRRLLLGEHLVVDVDDRELGPGRSRRRRGLGLGLGLILRLFAILVTLVPRLVHRDGHRLGAPFQLPPAQHRDRRRRLLRAAHGQHRRRRRAVREPQLDPRDVAEGFKNLRRGLRV
mmetsp:Transcript_5123/g.22787  ORF Transcript_5123/g.22787 Transcript_5123/m.22787 type:complete len:359 (+) Transcript_5123:324-1400(+)